MATSKQLLVEKALRLGHPVTLATAVKFATDNNILVVEKSLTEEGGASEPADKTVSLSHVFDKTKSDLKEGDLVKVQVSVTSATSDLANKLAKFKEKNPKHIQALSTFLSDISHNQVPNIEVPATIAKELISLGNKFFEVMEAKKAIKYQGMHGKVVAVNDKEVTVQLDTGPMREDVYTVKFGNRHPRYGGALIKFKTAIEAAIQTAKSISETSDTEEEDSLIEHQNEEYLSNIVNSRNEVQQYSHVLSETVYIPLSRYISTKRLLLKLGHEISHPSHFTEEHFTDAHGKVLQMANPLSRPKGEELKQHLLKDQAAHFEDGATKELNSEKEDLAHLLHDLVFLMEQAKEKYPSIAITEKATENMLTESSMTRLRRELEALIPKNIRQEVYREFAGIPNLINELVQKQKKIELLESKIHVLTNHEIPLLQKDLHEIGEDHAHIALKKLIDQTVKEFYYSGVITMGRLEKKDETPTQFYLDMHPQQAGKSYVQMKFIPHGATPRVALYLGKLSARSRYLQGYKGLY